MTAENFKRHFLPLKNKLYDTALKKLGNPAEAEDAVQTLFLKLWQQRDKLDDIKNHEHYCLTSLRNICIDRWRQVQRYETCEDISDIVDEVYEQPEEHDTPSIEEMIAKLPETQQRILTMHLLGCTNAEIEELTGMSPTTIRTTLSRARKRLRIIYFANRKI